MLPYAQILTAAPSFGIQTNTFGFGISWATNPNMVVDASTTLANPVWFPTASNTLTSGWSYFAILSGPISLPVSTVFGRNEGFARTLSRAGLWLEGITPGVWLRCFAAWE